MKILYIRTEGSVTDFYHALQELHIHTITLFDQYCFDPNHMNEQGYQELSKHINSNYYDAIISLLYFPKIAELCHSKGMYYISWVYDSPQVGLFDSSIFYDTNHIFIFDSYECQKLKEFGAKNVYYLPLAANINRIQSISISDYDVRNFSADISFVGSLYENNAYNRFYPYIPDTHIQEWKSYLNASSCNWGKIREWPKISTESTNFLCSNLPPENINHFQMNLPEFFGVSLLSQKLAEIERVTVLHTCASITQTVLYSGSACPEIPNLIRKGRVDYYTEMSKIFHLSRINLNVTLPSIVCGAPQRVFDIMACGGFVLTNYQTDLEELFQIGKDIETFASLEELTDKILFYLSHEHLRVKIALTGFSTVTNEYSFSKQIQKMLKIFQENR